MEFKTPQGNAAYQEVLRETGQALRAMEEVARELALAHPEAAVSISLHAAGRAAEVRIDGLAKAISTATEVDIQWSALAGRLTLAAGGH